MNTNTVVENPYLFIVGCPRSGTTLLQRIVNAHPQIAIVPELFWVTNPIRSKEKLFLEEEVTAQVLNSFLNHRRFPDLELDPSYFAAPENWTYADLLGQIFFRYKWIMSKRFVGNKTPQYVQNIPSLHAQWPQARFVHIIRDGRDVSLSVVNWAKADHNVGRYVPWVQDRIATSALYWKRKVLLGRQGRALPPDLYYEIRYESLIETPQVELTKLCNFLRVPYTDSMLNYHEHRPDTERAKNSKTWMPITQGLRDWQTQMSPADQEKFEALVGNFLDDLGYKRAFRDPSRDAKKYASTMTSLFVQGLRDKHKFVPEKMTVGVL